MKIEILKSKFNGMLAINVDDTRYGPDAGPWEVIGGPWEIKQEDVSELINAASPFTLLDVDGYIFADSENVARLRKALEKFKGEA